MYKKIIGTTLLIVLIGIVIYNGIKPEDSSVNEVDVTGDTSVNGTAIVSPNGSQGLKVGEKAIDFTLETLDGKKVTLSDYLGKKVFINFWASWCGPCRVEMPDMEKFNQEFNEEVIVLAINATGSEFRLKDVENFLDQGNFSFTTLLDPGDEITEKYRIVNIPTTYFIGTDGTIQEKPHSGPMTYEFMVEMKDKIN
ncbi:TlpA family protein disulfide reductase [Aquibacillus koreensis]|uniref:TlpA family protein disulfide reductase n=1 Tax=Aquibacillus koreensis TaxID=279446 RepID=A0A9X3WPM0_9BACI|nr:TlpA disulfide reductase family protein [Aquibacillus koreensis]MCT2536388.1 TlpA family protein disulfide reductase [Aquibacillus koreensis]MDC3421261.1 TlpA family protein disulfide reductase [Aquibacillus koreensis]